VLLYQACAVTIEDQVVVTGGTMLGLGKVKPVWLAEIGTRTAESFDGENWYSLPSLSRAKVQFTLSLSCQGTVYPHSLVLMYSLCSLGYNEFDFFLENKEYRPFDWCEIEI
jgi:hypothetical protein